MFVYFHMQLYLIADQEKQFFSKDTFRRFVSKTITGQSQDKPDQEPLYRLNLIPLSRALFSMNGLYEGK